MSANLTVRYIWVLISYICCNAVAGCIYGCVQVEALQDQVCELHKRIEDQRDLCNRRVLQQQETLARLSSTLTEKTSSADCMQRKLQESNAILDKLLQGIGHIFHLMHCDSAPILFLLGECYTFVNHIVFLN
jgi:uncharacterized coiled-coil protein SlyX